ncbi:DUF1800 domain-containing protein [Photobacterium angustum]|uniref:DUF1800 domain-containing protein n=1 Tax=Photobacterium angustum TaxID=661 RepID=A0A855SHC6_PHOAN|nr:DUF1800 family protein [Photobacterium angustum]KJF82391.1 hypothetical protein UB36_06270 [Photobacterium damselae subsp. damselae]KJG41767.1 hypothetical protein UA35_04270 [Photobacterium angustum]KJG46374.1 hypothetical protein UA31_06270 [Photobacterium angustum]KJG54382.1 hypothetical protein UA34_00835 [Photobacterium angustum]PSX09853.1 DUF1800 domain-containing protein [Photobacterium angustum]
MPALDVLYQEQPKQISAFLYRSTFGTVSEDITFIEQTGISRWFEDQYELPPSLHLPIVQRVTKQLNLKKTNSQVRIGTWLQHAITAPDQLRQRMAYALSQHFVVSSVGVGGRHEDLSAYYDLLVTHALGNYRDLLKAVTLNPIMGRYLTLRGSRKENLEDNTFPDENYAREVMQLFTIGLWEITDKGNPKLDDMGNPIATYNQDDVENMARALTGWNGGDLYQPMQAQEQFHDTDEKYILGHSLPAGQTAEQDLDSVVDILFHHKNTPAFFAIAMIKRFVMSNPRSGYIKRVSNAFKDNGHGVRGDLKATLYAVLTDPDVTKQLGDTGNQGKRLRKYHFGLITEPLIVATNLARALKMKPAGDYWNNWIHALDDFGQAPLSADTVFNFYMPDDTPRGLIEDHGLTSPEASLLTTHQMRMIHNQVYTMIKSYRSNKPNRWTYDAVKLMELHSSPEAYVEYVDKELMGGIMSSTVRQRILTIFDSIGVEDGLRRVESTLYAAFTAPEFFTQEALK